MASNTKAFTVLVGPREPNGTNPPSEESGSTLGPTISLVNQVSPTWVLTFVRWNYRDTLRTPNTNPNLLRKTLVVENDCLQVTVTNNKGTLTPNMTAILVETDVNYAVAIHPGDFVFVNMLNWESDARNLATRANNSQQINGANDGFKGFFKVQSVRKIIRSEPNTGIRTVLVKIDAFAFTEFNNTVYFNPNLINVKSLSNAALYANDIGAAYSNLVTASGKVPLQDIIAFLIQSIIGSGFSGDAQKVSGLTITNNTHFLIPLEVANLLGIASKTTTLAAKDVYRYLFGIQKYSAGTTQSLTSGLNPSNLQGTPVYPNFYYTTQSCPGFSLLNPDFWNNVKLWSILQQYMNHPLNELYTCFRVSPTGSVMPTVVFRQIPFTTEDFVQQQFNLKDSTAAAIPVTTFLSIPRWKIGAEAVYSLDLGTDEAARINFVQYYARSIMSKNGWEASLETSDGNYMFDKDDIARSGLRPYVISNQFNDLPDQLTLDAPNWARIMGDALIGGQLKLNGTFELFGIIDPIAVGDNLEFDGTVFHIEQITHACNINPITGMKTFRTIVSVSNGVSVDSSTAGTKYSYMSPTGGYQDRIDDYDNEQILPGISEAQDVIARTNNVDLPHEQSGSYPQPNSNKNSNNNSGGTNGAGTI